MTNYLLDVLKPVDPRYSTETPEEQVLRVKVQALWYMRENQLRRHLSKIFPVETKIPGIDLGNTPYLDLMGLGNDVLMKMGVPAPSILEFDEVVVKAAENFRRSLLNK